MSALVSVWPGPYPFEARQAYWRARNEGMSLARSMVVGSIASFKDAWIFRRKLARWIGCSVRTVQRAITEAKALGLVGVARAKQGEVPPGANTEIPCGWSHRWTIGWGKAVEIAKAEIAQTRLARVLKLMVGPKAKPTEAARNVTAAEVKAVIDAQRSPRAWSVEQIDAELARLARVRRNE